MTLDKSLETVNARDSEVTGATRVFTDLYINSKVLNFTPSSSVGENLQKKVEELSGVKFSIRANADAESYEDDEDGEYEEEGEGGVYEGEITPITIDPNLHPAIKHAFALGFRPGDKFNGRNLPPKGSKTGWAVNWEGTLTHNNIIVTPLVWVPTEKFHSEGRPKNKQVPSNRTFTDGLQWLKEENKLRAIYFHANVGRDNEAQHRFRATFFESDNKPIPEQLQQARSLGIKPSALVTTRNSVHAYFNGKGLSGEVWRYLQNVSAYIMGSDPALKDYPRPMRLAGFDHLKLVDGKIERVECKLVEINSEAFYTQEEVLSALNKYAEGKGIKPFSETRFDEYQWVVRKLSQHKNGVNYTHPNFDPDYFRTCEESEISDRAKRGRDWARLKEKQHKGKDCPDPELAWTQDIKQVAKRVKAEFKLPLQTIAPLSEPITVQLARNHTQGFTELGRANYHTCKCPVHNGNSFDSLHINVNTGFLHCQAGCEAEEIEITLRQLAKDTDDPLWNKTNKTIYSLGEDDQTLEAPQLARLYSLAKLGANVFGLDGANLPPLRNLSLIYDNNTPLVISTPEGTETLLSSGYASVSLPKYLPKDVVLAELDEIAKPGRVFVLDDERLNANTVGWLNYELEKRDCQVFLGVEAQKIPYDRPKTLDLMLGYCELQVINDDEDKNVGLKQKVSYQAAEVLNKLNIKPFDNYVLCPNGYIRDGVLVDELKNNLPKKGILVLSAPMATGKTTVIDNIINKEFPYSRVLSVAPTIALSHNSAERLKLPTREAVEEVGDLTLNEIWRVSVVCPSLHKVGERQAPGHSILILDESRQSLKFLHQANECNREELRPANIRALRDSIQNSDLIILSDAYLTNAELDYVRANRPDLPVYVFEVPVSPKKREVYIMPSKQVLEDLLKEALDEGKKVLIASDGQNQAEAIDKDLSAKGTKVLRIDRYTKEEEQQSDYLADLTKDKSYLNTHKPQVVVYTPTLSSGVSMEEEYFDLMLCYNFHLLPTDFMQLIGRERPQIPLYVWADSDIKNNSSWTPSGQQETILGKAENIKLLCEHAISAMPDAANISQVVAMLQTILEQSKQGTNLDLNFLCQIKARDSYQDYDRKKKLINTLQASGYTVEEMIILERDGALSSDIQEAKKDIKHEFAVEVIMSEPVEEVEGEKLLEKKVLTQAERVKRDRYRFDKIWGGFLSDDTFPKSILIAFYEHYLSDRGRWLATVRERYAYEKQGELSSKELERLYAKLTQFKGFKSSPLNDLARFKPAYYKFVANWGILEKLESLEKCTSDDVVKFMYKLDDAGLERLKDTLKSKDERRTSVEVREKFINQLPQEYVKGLKIYFDLVLPTTKNGVDKLICKVRTAVERFGYTLVSSKKKEGRTYTFASVDDSTTELGQWKSKVRRCLTTILKEKDQTQNQDNAVFAHRPPSNVDTVKVPAGDVLHEVYINNYPVTSPPTTYTQQGLQPSNVQKPVIAQIHSQFINLGLDYDYFSDADTDYLISWAERFNCTVADVNAAIAMLGSSLVAPA
ncbi:hypothetical protein H6G04_33325 [Calothrix membranacea FACHB-236]|nr:hypothetical protein [Calothrix membranacea FACHB-236]